MRTLGKVGSALDFWRFFRDAAVGDVQQFAGQPVTLRVVGKPLDLGQQLASRLGLDPGTGYALADLPDAMLGGMLICALRPDERLSPEEQARIERLLRSGTRALMVGRDPDTIDLGRVRWLSSNNPALEVERVIAAALDLAGDRAISLARRYPAFRAEAAQRVIQDTARLNARLTVVASLPAVVPIVGNLIGAAADFFVLTRNQIEMLYRLAAIYGRDVDSRWRMYAEIAPIVGSALVWRTIARELAALAPGLLGTIPKIAIAYTGTFVVGQSANFYYTHGRRPPRSVVGTYYDRASQQVSRLGRVLGRG